MGENNIPITEDRFPRIRDILRKHFAIRRLARKRHNNVTIIYNIYTHVLYTVGCRISD